MVEKLAAGASCSMKEVVRVLQSFLDELPISEDHESSDDFIDTDDEDDDDYDRREAEMLSQLNGDEKNSYFDSLDAAVMCTRAMR